VKTEFIKEKIGASQFKENDFDEKLIKIIKSKTDSHRIATSKVILCE